MTIHTRDSNRNPLSAESKLTGAAPSPLDPQLAALPERVRSSMAKRKAADAEVESAKVYQFPLWPEPACGVPNELIRSALFSAVHGNNRRLMQQELVASQGPYQIEFTGGQLTQAHLDVFEGVMHMARGATEGNFIKFSGHALLKLIGRQTGKSQHDWLYAKLTDLSATCVSVKKDSDSFFFSSLIQTGAGSLKRGEYSIQITRDLIKLFDHGFTQIQWEQRRKLKQKPLACWLQMYYSSHAKPYPVKVDFLRKQSGSNIAELWKFRQNLKAALEEIQAVGVIKSWNIEDNDKVMVDRFSSSDTPIPGNTG